MSREHSNIDPSTTAALFAVYRITCVLVDNRTKEKLRRDLYFSHDDGVILVDRGDGNALQPLVLDQAKAPKQFTIGQRLPAAEISNEPVNPNRTPIVTSLLLFADLWMPTDDDGQVGAAVKLNQHLDRTLPETSIPRGTSPLANPIVNVLPQFSIQNEALHGNQLDALS